jgi:ribonucleoside-diphosphate reductase alpha chain
MKQNEIKVIKRDGRKEILDYNKINKVLIWATENIKDVSASDVAMNAKLQIHDGITTEQIHRVMIKSADELTTEKNPNYQFVAGNLCNYLLRKKIFGSVTNLPHLYDVIKHNVEKGVYDSLILEKYSKEEIGKINNFVKHDRDFDFPYCGIQQLIDKYLVQDRKSGDVFETPQYMYILISMTLFSDYNKENKLEKIKSFYDDISKFKINLPTPIMAGVRAPGRQWSSCTLIDVGDSLDSIFNSNTAIGYYTSKRAGIGINAGRIRAVGDKIRSGEVIHTGVIPYLKMFESTVKSCTQNGIRGGSATVHFPFWHKEIQDILVLKNNKGTDDNRVRKLDYSIQFCRLFYKRFIENKDITLFSPADVPDLMDAFGLDNDKFDILYEKYENKKNINKKKINARDFFNQFCQERIGTGRMYVMNIDNANTHSSFKDKIYMSNLCQEINLPTTPLSHIDDNDETNAEIALCVLAAINCGAIKDFSEIESICENTVRMLDFVVENQDYPVNSAKKMLKRRSLGIGITNLAYFLAKNNLNYDDENAVNLVDELTEYIQYYCIKASVNLAKEYGKCEWFYKTKYSEGVLPIDTYNKNVDNICKRQMSLDWEFLREEIKKYGMRNSTLTAMMPCESSSVVTNSTNGLEPARAYITTKRSKKGTVKFVLPELSKLKNKYVLAFDLKDNKGLTNIYSVIQKYIDQGISVNHYYDMTKYDNKNIPLSEVAKDILYFYQMGGKQIYYSNTYDGKSDYFENTEKEEKLINQQSKNDDSFDCESGACSI